ncbi:MAG: HD domain-containing protein [Pirellulaceae bacterium]
MTPSIQSPELLAFDRPVSLLRIPDQTDVPMTDRVRRIIDTEPFRRLSQIRQLGFVSLVYPGAVHHRLEHSLGVYRSCLLFLRQLCLEPAFVERMESKTIDALILASLLHDIGHYPFCHPVEDMGDPAIIDHEDLAANYLNSAPLADLITRDWSCAPSDVVNLLRKNVTTAGEKIAASILSGPVDVDKLDYLYRDSLHAGVPYGRNFDSPRLIGSLCLNRERDGIAITTKGRTAAELMVFARYVMFSEVYWHHAVRSATAMFQRLFYECRPRLSLAKVYSSDDQSFPPLLQRAAVEEPFLLELFYDLFGTTRNLYKRWDQFSFFRNEELFQRIARRPFSWLVMASRMVARRIGEALQTDVPPTYVLIDAPPQGLEVQFNVDVFEAKSHTFFSLRELSPVVAALAERQFDDFVKQVRVFVHPSLRNRVEKMPLEKILDETILELDSIESNRERN